MTIHMKRWNDRKTKEDGYRLLVCRTRPRGTAAGKEGWDGWCSNLGPSAALDAELHGAAAPAIAWEEYQRRYAEEMKAQGELIDELARLAMEGKSYTLLCSTACKDDAHCHRSLLKDLIEKRMAFLEKVKN